MPNNPKAPAINPVVESVINAYPNPVKSKLMMLRQLIYTVARENPEIGLLEETTKWGQPSYLTPQTKSGSTIRIDGIRSEKDQYAMYFHCQTTLVDTFKEMYKNDFVFVGNRSILFHVNDKPPLDKLKHCVKIALTYHLNKA